MSGIINEYIRARDTSSPTMFRLGWRAGVLYAKASLVTRKAACLTASLLVSSAILGFTFGIGTAFGAKLFEIGAYAGAVDHGGAGIIPESRSVDI